MEKDSNQDLRGIQEILQSGEIKVNILNLPETEEELFQTSVDFFFNFYPDFKIQFYMREEGSVDQLFNEVINIRGIHVQLGMNESTVRALRKKCNDGSPISVEKKREILEAAGYKMKQEERWGR
jgi:hypothetical protein